MIRRKEERARQHMNLLRGQAAASGASICASTCAGSGRIATRVGAVFLLALLAAGLEMIEPLFMRFIIDTGAAEHRAGHGVAPWPPPSGGRWFVG